MILTVYIESNDECIQCPACGRGMRIPLEKDELLIRCVEPSPYRNVTPYIRLVRQGKEVEVKTCDKLT